MAKYKLSRAKWKGSSYFRKDSKTWRNKPSGQIYSGDSKSIGSPIVGEMERTNNNLYDRDKLVRKRRK